MAAKLTLNRLLRITSNIVVKIISEDSGFYRGLALWGLALSSKKRLARRTSMRLDVPVTEHCNLNCKHCCTFSPIAEKIFLDTEAYEKNLKKLVEIVRDKMDEILLAGGEPLLHPKLIEIIKMTRQYFMATTIKILTNGILLEKQSDEFWNTCGQNNIIVEITKYPIKLEFERILEKAGIYGVKFGYWGESGGGGAIKEPLKTMWKRPFDLDGKQDVKKSWKYCNEANYCIRLRNGKLYTCATIPCVEHFNNYFGKNLEVKESDYIEIDKINNLDELLDFFCTPKQFCRYCKRKDVFPGQKWAVSKRDLEEWV
jgi:MoaA/NifB/PqqE/SkfB family radical SAM enzyme